MAVEEALPRASVRHGPRGGKKANLSPLMTALESAQEGEVVNACPFGCQDEELDRLGSCVHHVGTTLPVPRDQAPTHFETLEEPDLQGNRRTNGKNVQKVRKGDKLFRITSCYRVYREQPDAKE